MTTFQKLLLELTIVALFLFTLIGFYYIHSENKQRQFNNCKYLYEQRFLSLGKEKIHLKLKEMRDRGSSQNELDDYWASLDKETQQYLKNRANLLETDSNLRANQNCRNLLLNP